MLRPGDAAPDFVLKNHEGIDVRLSTLGSGPIVLFFYPRDSGPASLRQVRGFGAHLSQFADHGAAVVGVSLDDPATHAEFRLAHGVPYALLSDPDGHAHDLYGAWRTSLLGRRPLAVRRCTYLIDADGVIAYTYARVNPFAHARQVLKDLDRMRAQQSWGGTRRPLLRGLRSPRKRA